MDTTWQRDCGSAKVLRLALQPLTLGHVFLLVDEGSVFVTGENSEDPIGQLSLAVFVCSQSPDDARASMSRWWAPRFFRVWAWTCRNLDYHAEAERFVEWFSYQCKGPATKGGGSSKPMASPWWVNLLATLMGEVGLSYTDAMKMPIRHARQIISALGEARGTMDLMTREEELFMEATELWDRERRELGMTIDEYRNHWEARRAEAQRN